MPVAGRARSGDSMPGAGCELSVRVVVGSGAGSWLRALVEQGAGAVCGAGCCERGGDNSWSKNDSEQRDVKDALRKAHNRLRRYPHKPELLRWKGVRGLPGCEKCACLFDLKMQPFGFHPWADNPSVRSRAA